MGEYWGYHLILDCSNCNVEKVKSRENIETFTKALVKEIGMVAFGEPTIEHFSSHDPAAAGFSLVQLIETSAISGHFVDKNGDCYLDIFSCKPFCIDTAQGVVKKFFNPKKIKITHLTRQA